LCCRYGWKFSSHMPDVYISRSGMETKALDEKFTQTELGTVKDDLVKMEEAVRIKDDRIRQLQESVQILQHNLQVVSQVLSLDFSSVDAADALQKKPQAPPG
jgi:hypothetical protein